MVYKETNDCYIEWQRLTTSSITNDNEWYNEWQRVTLSGTMSDNEWKRVTKNENEWQQVTAIGKTNENDTVHLKEWMIAFLSVIKTDTLLQGMDVCN